KPVPFVEIHVEVFGIGWKRWQLTSSGGDVHSQDGDPAAMPIGEGARRTGVTVPTLRAWERRYGLLLPVRTAGGHRRYRDEDVQRGLAVLELTRQRRSAAAVATHGAPPAARAAAPGRPPRRSPAANPPPPPARPRVDELRDRLWSALDQALRELPA